MICFQYITMLVLLVLWVQLFSLYLLYNGVSTYVGLYGSGLFNFRSYVKLRTLFACFLGFDVPEKAQLEDLLQSPSLWPSVSTAIVFLKSSAISLLFAQQSPHLLSAPALSLKS